MKNCDFGIIGGGIAGVSFALNLKRLGIPSVIYDSQILQRKCIPPYASLNPKYGINSPVQNLLTYESISYAKNFYPNYLKKNEYMFKGLHRYFEDRDPREIIEKIKNNNPYLSTEIKFEHKEINGLCKNAIFYKTAGWIRTKSLFEKKLGLNIVNNQIDEIKSENNNLALFEKSQKINEHEYLIISNPQTLNKILSTNLSNQLYSGSIVIGENKISELSNFSKDGYVIFDKKKYVGGSSYHKDKLSIYLNKDDEIKYLTKKISWIKEKISTREPEIWSGERYTTKQRLPSVGRLEVPASSNENIMQSANIFINTFYGSRGFSLAPYLSKLLIKLINNNKISQTEQTIIEFLRPNKEFKSMTNKNIKKT